MKTLARKSRPVGFDFTAEDVRQALLRARRTAVKLARLHKVPLVYLEKGRIVRRIP
jgi:hypothetical protein